MGILQKTIVISQPGIKSELMLLVLALLKHPLTFVLIQK